ncbi:MAG: hypothetical protein EPO35_08835 [Acidobacteria bacterium]|nr:MAG: hypothetical protein EPO35_08835 [Acidobacteriota bacterium]
MNRHRVLLAAAAALLWPAAAAAQAPPTAPPVLTLPSSARVAALAGAWVAGRDQDVVFHNPAQLVGVRTDFSVSMARLGDKTNMASLTSVYTAGKLSFTLGWGVHLIDFDATNRQNAVATIAGAVLYKGLRIGAAGKYAADRRDINQHALLADVGVARNIWGGAVALAVQNLGHSTLSDLGVEKLPRRVAAGFSKAQSAGPLDLALFTQVSHRSGWNSAAAGFEAGYSWIEGLSVTGRIGVRRPERTDEKPVSLGGAFTADRLTLEYALQLFDNSKRSHLVTIRWR